jgi:hypothetical protein
MAKSKKVMRKNKPAKRQSRAVVRNDDALDAPAAAAANMFYDPCGSTLVPTVYPGDSGYVNRFTSAFTTGNSTGEVNGIVIFKPGNNLMFNGSPTTSAVTFTVSLADTQAPGAGFFNTNATKVRCAGACLVVRPLATPTNATGVLYYGVVPASVVANGSTPSLDQLIQLLPQSVSVAQALMNPLEIKWSPGTFDDRYSPISGITGDDDTDRNVIVVAAVGMAAASGFNTRATAIYEWAPQANLGVAIDSTQVAPSRCTPACILRNLKRKDPEWWWSLGYKTLNGVKDVATSYFQAGAPGAIMATAKFANSLRGI